MLQTNYSKNIKFISYSKASQKQKQRIVFEINTLIGIKHPNILKYYDYKNIPENRQLKIHMEKCQGGSLRQLIDKYKQARKYINQQRIWNIFHQLVQALDYLHFTHNVVHRNISPQNIYFQDPNRKVLKLAGFNFAKKLNYQQILSQTALPNTYYISPQLIDNGTYTKQSDIWSLGCLMYELCTLNHPFKQKNQFQTLKMIKQMKPRKLQDYSKQLNRVIFWCLDKHAQVRPTTFDLNQIPQIYLRTRQLRYQQKQAEAYEKQKSMKILQQKIIKKQQKVRNKLYTKKLKGFQSNLTKQIVLGQQ